MTTYKTVRNAAAMMVAGLALASTAQAGFTTYGEPSWGTEQDLDTILSTLYGEGNLERVHDYGTSSNDEFWLNLGSGAVQAQAKYAAFDHTLGVVSGTGPSAMTELFTLSGMGYVSDGSAASAEMSIDVGSPFRFALASGGSTFYSDAASNTGGLDHMITWRVTGTAGGYTDNVVGAYIVAWEDFEGGGDLDYNDLVMEVRGVEPVPEPTTIALFSLGTLGMGIRRLRQRKGSAPVAE